MKAQLIIISLFILTNCTYNKIIPVEKMGKEFWNDRYATTEYVYGLTANQYFAKLIDSLPKGRLLLPGEGEGRNAVYAASQDWQVDAFDLSEEGQTKALQLAAEKKVKINYFIADYANPKLEGHSYNAVALIYAHIPRQIRAESFCQLTKAVQPKGYFIMEVYSVNNLKSKYSFGPKNKQMLYKVDELKELLADFEMLTIQEEEIEQTDGNRFGKGIVIRVLAKKKQ